MMSNVDVINKAKGVGMAEIKADMMNTMSKNESVNRSLNKLEVDLCPFNPRYVDMNDGRNMMRNAQGMNTNIDEWKQSVKSGVDNKLSSQNGVEQNAAAIIF